MSPPTPSSPFTPPRHSASAVRDLRGGLQLAVDGAHAAIGQIERLHQRVAEVSPPVRGLQPGHPGSGWPHLVYRGLRGTTDLLGGAADLALATVQAAVQRPQRDSRVPEQPRRSRASVLAALNATLGDHLHRTDNPLAVPLQLHQRDAADLPLALVLVHDLGLDELQWCQRGHDHGQALAEALPCTAVYVAYNSGRHVWSSGRDLAAELEQRMARWRVPLQGLLLLGHGLGGLVLRSALHQAVHSGLAWPVHLRKLVFLGTPLGGADLAHWPLAQGRLGLPAAPARWGRRSDGMADFEAGRFLEQDAPGPGVPSLTSLPPAARAYAIAGRIGAGPGDGLVSEDSALGRTGAGGLDLDEAHRWTAEGVDHLGLLASQAVFQTLRGWLAA